MGKDQEDNNTESDIESTESEIENPADDEVLLIDAIEQSIEEINLSIDFKDIGILDDEDAKRKDIEALKDQLSPTILTRLFSLGNSNHFARIQSGKITEFAEVVIHLGTEYTKITAIFIAFSELAITEQTKLVIARCFATSKIAEIIAYQMNLSVQDRNMVILSGLFIEIGKLIMLLHAENEDIELEEDYIDQHHP